MNSLCALYATEKAKFRLQISWPGVSRYLPLATVRRLCSARRPFREAAQCVSIKKSPSSSAPARAPAKAWATAAPPPSPSRAKAPPCCASIAISPRRRRPRLIARQRRQGGAFEADVTEKADAQGDGRGRRKDAGAASTSCTTMSASASPAAMPSCPTSPRRRSTAAWRSTCTSCILAGKHVLPIMRAQKSGVIINISSMAAITTIPMSPTRRPRRR